jgi:DNA-binding transcriptional MerR regulator
MIMFTISEAAEFLGCSSHTIRQKEKKNIFPGSRRGANGYRYYTISDLARLWQCQYGVLDRVAIEGLARILMAKDIPPEEASQLIKGAIK